MRMYVVFGLCLALSAGGCKKDGRGTPPVASDQGNIGMFAKWAKVEIPLSGPPLTGTGSPNPFAILVDATFSGPSGQAYTVPCFYDGDGNGGLNGNVWVVRFSADEVGTWSFVTNSAEPLLDGTTGTFTVVAPSSGAPDFYQWGRLEAVGTAANTIRYLKFRDGPYWLKAGCDDPENFLGDSSTYDTVAKRKAAVDYLSARGVNSMYMMTDNIGGDNQDVWPWLGSTSAEAQANAGADARFDVAKLDEWRDVFEHMQTKGVVTYLVLEDDAAWSSYDHPRYYRELIARFGYLPGLIFNFCEEYSERYTLATALSYMQQLKDIDPYDHPRGVHNVNDPTSAYANASQVDFTAIQTSTSGGPFQHNEIAIEWINLCAGQGQRVLMVGFDEGRPLLDRQAWWSAYMGGGVWEAHVSSSYDRPMSTWEPAWTEMGGARAFVESVPFWLMQPSNALVVSGTAFCLAQVGEAYALYLPSGGMVSVNLASGNTYTVEWWNPANGRTGSFQGTGMVSGGVQTFSAPGSGDWALRVVKN
ncbi:MAG: DUF5060 domain-containing protein [Planctomycetes bacterium]|nr:DUF5060 domain-containing protein [Planctomycetota bacterium]